MLIQGQVGPAVSSTSLGAGTNPNLRLDNLGGLNASQLLPRYYETTYRRQMYTVANQSVTATTAALATTYTGLVLGNPSSSTVNVVLTKVGYGFILAQTTAGVIGLMTGTGFGTTFATGSITPRNRFVGSVGSQCLASSGSITLPTTPALETIIGSYGTGATTTTQTQGPTIIDLEGSLIIPPGGYAAFYTSAATVASSFFGSFQWVEVPL